MKQLKIRIDVPIHQSVRERSAALGITMSDYVAGAITQRLAKDEGNTTKPDEVPSGPHGPGTKGPTENNKEKEEGKEENPPTPPFKKKGEEEKEKNSSSSSNARARKNKLDVTKKGRKPKKARASLEAPVAASTAKQPDDPPSEEIVRDYAAKEGNIPKEIVDEWLRVSKANGWFVKDRYGNIIPIDSNSWRILLNGFALNYNKKRGKKREENNAKPVPVPRTELRSARSRRG